MFSKQWSCCSPTLTPGDSQKRIFDRIRVMAVHGSARELEHQGGTGRDGGRDGVIK